MKALTEHNPFGLAPWVYFIKCLNYVKIGKTDNLHQRIKHINTETPFELDVIAIVPDEDKTQEHKYHRLFDHLQAKGEWFHFTQQMQHAIEAIKKKFPEEQLLIERFKEYPPVRYTIKPRKTSKIPVPEGKKKCGTCEGIYLVEDFTKDASRRDGRDKRCKLCKSYYKKLWQVRRYSNGDRINELRALEEELQERKRINFVSQTLVE